MCNLPAFILSCRNRPWSLPSKSISSHVMPRTSPDLQAVSASISKASFTEGLARGVSAYGLESGRKLLVGAAR